MNGILDHAIAASRRQDAALIAKKPCNWVLTKRVVAVRVIHSRHKYERRSPGNPRRYAGRYFNYLNLHIKIGAYFLIAKQKRLSKNQLTACLYKLCTQLSTKIVDNFL